MLKKSLTFLLICGMLLLIGCTIRELVLVDSNSYRYLVNKGDVIIRQNIEPKRMVIEYDGVIVSNGEIIKLDKVYQQYLLEN